MMRLQKYILNERSRGTEIGWDEAITILKTNCQEALANRNFIFRGVEAKREYYIISPARSTRISRNTHNYYTLLFDNLQTWKKYPKRSKSIICTTDSRYALDQGYTYVVFPFDSAKIGVCPSEDIWGAFRPKLDVLSNFNDDIRALVIEYKLSSPNTYRELTNFFKEVDNIKDTIISDRWLAHDSPFWKPYLDNPDLKLIDFIKNFFNPDKHGFKLTTIKDFNIAENREIWTDSTSVLILEKNISKIEKILGIAF